MVPFGVVVRYDSRGNAVVKPEQGRNAVILSDSNATEFPIGTRVLYGSTKPGRNVEFTANYIKAGDLKIMPSVNDENYWYLQYLNRKNEFQQKGLEQKLEEINLSGIKALVLFDPTQNPYGPGFYFVTITREISDIEDVEKIIYGLTGELPSELLSYYGANGLVGSTASVSKEFRSNAIVNPKQQGILFIPVEGLVYETYPASHRKGRSGMKILREVLEQCVEAVKL